METTYGTAAGYGGAQVESLCFRYTTGQTLQCGILGYLMGQRNSPPPNQHGFKNW